LMPRAMMTVLLMMRVGKNREHADGAQWR